MLPFLLSYLLGLSIVNANVIRLPGQLKNQTGLLSFPHMNTTLDVDELDPINGSSLTENPVDKNFGTVIAVYPDIRISAKSTIMSVLKAMIQLSYSEGTHVYAGGTFSFRSYTDVKINIARGETSSSTLQYRYALWGLFKAAKHMFADNVFVCTVVQMYWSGSGVPASVGVIHIVPDPLPDIAGSNEIYDFMNIGQQAETLSTSLDWVKSTKNNDTDLVTSTNAGKLIVFIELQGQTLSIPEVFMTLFLALVHLASFRTADIVHEFVVRDPQTKMELVYEPYGAPRTSAPFFTFHAAARALGRLPKYMFAEGRFEAAVFILEIGGTPVGQGFLRKFSSTTSITSARSEEKEAMDSILPPAVQREPRKAVEHYAT